MHGGEDHSGTGPQAVLDVVRVLRTRLGPLAHQAQPATAQRLRRLGEEDVPDGLEPLGRQVPAVGGPVAVRPLVVTRGQDEGIVELVVEVSEMEEVRVVAARSAALDVAHVHHEAHVLVAVDVLDQRREPGRLLRPVRCVADQRELERAVAAKV